MRVVVVLIDSYSGLLDEMALLDLERLFRVLVPVVEAGWLTNVFSILIPTNVYDNSRVLAGIKDIHNRSWQHGKHGRFEGVCDHPITARKINSYRIAAISLDGFLLIFWTHLQVFSIDICVLVCYNTNAALILSCFYEKGNKFNLFSVKMIHSAFSVYFI